jgi:hypothetical protein
MSLELLLRNGEEDAVQEAVCKVLNTLDDRPNAESISDFAAKYEHVAPLIMRVYKNECINEYRRPNHLPLTESHSVVYTTEDAFDECTTEQRQAIGYYLSAIQQGSPLTAAQRAKLKRLRKKTGLALSTKGV